MASLLDSIGSGHQLHSGSDHIDNDKAHPGPDTLVAPEMDRLAWDTATDNSNIIWVPAAKHPQIAPAEFLEWIKTHGNATTYNKNPVKRQRSALSVTYTSSEEEDEEDEEDDDDCPSNVPIDTIDSKLPDQDTVDSSPVLANQEGQSLLRRKALSSRGRSNTSKAEQPSDINNNDINGNINIINTKMTEPVIVNELVDLGPMPEVDSSYHLLHRMHSAETHMLPSASLNPPTRKRNELRRSVSDRFSWISNSDKKKSPWIRGLFDKYRRVNDESTAKSIPSPKPVQRSSSHNLLSYFSRKLSLSSKSTDKSPRRRYSNILQQAGISTKKHQMETNDPTNDQRLPLHLERAIYRLSHAKLSNPRRPLREQVIISNFMFWYLSIINMHPRQIQAQEQHFIQSNNHQHQDTNRLPLKRPSPNPNSAELSQISTTTRPPSPLSSKNKKDKYKPIRNLSFGNPHLDSKPCQ